MPELLPIGERKLTLAEQCRAAVIEIEIRQIDPASGVIRLVSAVQRMVRLPIFGENQILGLRRLSQREQGARNSQRPQGS